MNGEHLHESRRHALLLPDEERFKFIREDVKINTEHMENVKLIARNMLSITRGSMEAPCLIVSAGSNHGKTTICNAVRGMGEAWCHQVRYVTFVKDTSKLKPLDRLIRALGVNPSKDGVDIAIITEHCLANDIRAVFMDEFHDSIKALTKPEQEKFLSTLRGMCGAPLYMSFFVFGTEAALNALGHDPQYVRRFEKYELTPWQLKDAEYLNFLDTWEEIAPLAKPSGLSSEELSTFIHKSTQGVIGNITSLLKAAGCLSVSWGLEQITIEALESATKSKWLSRPRIKDSQ